MICKNCGKELNDDAKFCARCGSRMGSPYTIENTSPAPRPVNVNTNSNYVRAEKDFSELKSDARKQLKGNIFTLFITYIIWGLFIGGVAAGMMILLVTKGSSFLDEYLKSIANADPENMPQLDSKAMMVFVLGYMGFMLFVMICGALMQFGVVANANKMYRGQKATIGTGFSGFKRFGSAVGTILLCSIYTALWGMVPIIGTILSAVKTYSYACALYIKHENPNMGINDAITLSREIMDGNKLRLFLYDLFFGIVGVLIAFVTLGIGLIWWLPYAFQTRYNFYQNIKKSATKE